MRAKVTIGIPELQRWARGEAVTVRLEPGTHELTISPSMMAQSQLKTSNQPKSVVEELLGRLGQR
jgi:hypothetical protein